MLPSAHPLPNGLVIMFEGIDGVGKTTQLELAQAELERAGWPVMATRNMGGTPIGEALRKVIKSPVERPPLSDFYISLAIQEPLLDLIDEARRESRIVLMDRGPLSLAAYQISGAGVDETIGWKHVGNGMERLNPEAVILYDMEPAAALQRKREHSDKTDYFESKPLEYFKRVAEGFRAASKRYPAVTVIDGSQAIPALHDQTMAVIAELLTKPS